MAKTKRSTVANTEKPAAIESIDDLAADSQRRAEEFMSKHTVPWDMVAYYKDMSIRLLVLKAEIISKLRNYIPATKELSECEELMHTCLSLANKHKYTHPSWRRDIATVDYHLVALSEINEMLANNQWPTDIDGNPVRLSTYLDSILWY